MSAPRRQFITGTAAAAVASGLCASVVMASVLGFDKKYGIKIIPTKEADFGGSATSWST